MTPGFPLRTSPPNGLLLGLAVLLALAPPALGNPEDYADYVHPEDRTSLFGADARDVAFMGGGIAVVAATESLKVVQVDSSGTAVVASIRFNSFSVALAGGTCVAVGTANGIVLFDVTDPADPQLRQIIELGGQVDHLASFPKSGGGFVLHAAVGSTYLSIDVVGCESASSLRAVTLSDPINGVDGTESIAVVGTQSCLVVIDATTLPASILGTTPGTFGDVQFSPASDSRVYTTQFNRFAVVDITDPSAPTVIFVSLPFPAIRIAPCDPGTTAAGQKGSFAAQGMSPSDCLDIIAVAEDDFGVRTYDVSDPSEPILIGAVQLPGSIAGLDWRAGHIGAVGADPLGFQLVHASNPRSPPKLGLVPNLNTPVAAYLEQERDLFYVIDGLPTKIYDVSNPTAPIQRSMMNTGGIDIYAFGNHAYIVDGSQMQVWDTSDPDNPVQVTSLGGAYLSVEGDADQPGLLAAARFSPDNAIEIIDVSNPASPTVRGSAGLPSPFFSLDTIGATATVALGENGVGVVDFSEPDFPILSTFTTLTPAKSASFTNSEDRILVGHDRGISLYDADGTLLGACNLPTLREDNDIRLARYGGDSGFPVSQADSTRDVAYAITFFGTMYVIDITDDPNPFVIGEYTEPGVQPLFLEVGASALYLGDGSLAGQTLILPPQVLNPPTTDVPGPDRRSGSLVLRAPAPNPFTGSARIRFVLGKPGTVDLAVYDVAGRELRRLASGPREAGEYALSWDGRSDAGSTVAAGVYFLRLAAGSQVAVRRIVRLP